MDVLIGWSAALGIIAYLLGGIPFGYLIARVRGIDIRRHGSGNIGATNVGRTLGRGWGVLVFLLDAGKCCAVMLVASRFVQWRDGPVLARAWALAVTGLAAIIGSVAPVYLRFRGGKAVSATVGTLLGVWPDLALPAIGCLLIWIALAVVTRYVSVASMLAVGAHPMLMLGVAAALHRPLDETYPLVLLSVAVAAIVVVRHRGNIARLRAGTEQRIGASANRPEPGGRGKTEPGPIKSEPSRVRSEPGVNQSEPGLARFEPGVNKSEPDAQARAKP